MDRTWTLHWLQAAGTLAPWRARIRAEIDAAFAACAHVMRPPRVDIVLHQIHHWPVTELGFGGSAPSRNTMFLGFDTDHPAMEQRLVGGLRRVVLHEVHHCLRRAGPGYGVRLGEALVSEGLADHFVIECLGGEPYMWSIALDDAQLADAAAKAEPVLWRDGVETRRWLRGDPPTVLPWSGYSLGWRLAQTYLALHPGQRPSTLAGALAETVIDDAWPVMLDGLSRPMLAAQAG
jgi:hypothetical protein